MSIVTGSTPVLCLVGLVSFVALVIIVSAVRVVPEYQRLVVFRLGRCVGSRGPGIVLLLPVIDRAVKVDLREQVREILNQTAITQDNATVLISFLLHYKVFDPEKSVLQVGNFESAAQNMAVTMLRAVIGDITLGDVLFERAQITHMLHTRLGEITERWGVRLTKVEIREIIPSASRVAEARDTA